MVEALARTWTDILERYSDPDRRWRLLTPTRRGVIVGRLPDSGVPLRGSSEPPGVPRPPSFIPVAGWKPHVHDLRVNHVGLCEGLIVRVRRDGKPVLGEFVMLHTSQGRSVYQGQTKDRYRLAYDVGSVAGEIPVRGAHLGDDISAYEFHGPSFVQIGRKRIETCTGRLVVDASVALPVAVQGRFARVVGSPAAAPVIRSVWPADQAVLESLEEDVRADVSNREHIASGPYALTGPTEGRLKTPAGRGANVRRSPRRPLRGRRIATRNRVQRHRGSVRRHGCDRTIRHVRTRRPALVI